jgi:hypothetical protein
MNHPEPTKEERCPTCDAKYDTPYYEPALCTDPWHTKDKRP